MSTDGANKDQVEAAGTSPETAAAETAAPGRKLPSFGGYMGSMWLYTTLRFGLFFVLWGILLLVGVSALLAALVALVLSVPLSFVLLAKPRARFTANLEARVDARRVQRTNLDAELDPDAVRRAELDAELAGEPTAAEQPKRDS